MGQSLTELPEVRQQRHHPDVDWDVVAVAKAFPGLTRTGPHSHDRAQLLFAVEGLMVARTATGTWLVPRGHALWIPPHVIHDVSMHGDVSMRTAYVAAAATHGASQQCRVLKVGPLLEAALVALSEETAGERRAARTSRLGWLIVDEVTRAPAAPVALPLPHDPRLSTVARALIAEPGRAWSIDQWSQEAGLSRRTLTRRFRSETGLSFGTWRSRLRLLAAFARLADGEPIARVAASLGYRDVAAFRAMARRHLGEDLPDGRTHRIGGAAGSPHP